MEQTKIEQLCDLNFKLYAKNELGYDSFTTFWQDFTIAERFWGVAAIKDTFNRAFNEWKSDHKYLTELVLVLKIKAEWFGHLHKVEFERLYSELWQDSSIRAQKYLRGEGLSYYNHVFGIINANLAVEDDDFKLFAKEELGYDCLTSYWDDLTAAERSGGAAAVKDCCQQLFERSKSDYRLLTELVLVLNHKIWKFHNTGHVELAKLYNHLWQSVDQYAVDHLTDEAAVYYYQVLD